MAEADLKFIFAIVVVGTLWLSFTSLFYQNQLAETSLPVGDNETSVFSSMTFSFGDIINQMFFTEDVNAYYVNMFIFSFIIFGLAVVVYRQIRSGT